MNKYLKDKTYLTPSELSKHLKFSTRHWQKNAASIPGAKIINNRILFEAKKMERSILISTFKAEVQRLKEALASLQRQEAGE